ncbi:MAG: electron transfer flavoprotein subunit beta/FixA family protein [Calditrichaeota bacterium]|nr:electron transfer flavoprotein subunit beta/FixA family protein [Calditrichota bacterium]
MKCLVLIKEVPDTEAKIVIADDGKSIVKTDLKYILNPYDEYAIEEATKLAEEKNAECTLVAAGNAEMTKSIRNAIAKSANKMGNIAFQNVIHLQIDGTIETNGLAEKVAEIAAEIKPDLVFLGKQYIDNDNYLMAPFLADKMGFACATVVTKIDYSGDSLTVQREIEGGTEVIDIKMPAVISLQKGVNEPRYAGMKGIMNAKKIAIDVRETTLSDPLITTIKMEMPPQKDAGKQFSGDNQVEELVKALKEEAKAL